MFVWYYGIISFSMCELLCLNKESKKYFVMFLFDGYYVGIILYV